MTIKDQDKMYMIWIQTKEWQKNKKQDSGKFVQKVSELLTLWGDMDVKKILRKYGGQRKELDEEIKNDLICLYFKMFKDFTLELLKQTNELNIIQMDERIIKQIKEHYSLILNDLKEILISQFQEDIVPKKLSRKEEKQYE